MGLFSGAYDEMENAAPYVIVWGGGSRGMEGFKSQEPPALPLLIATPTFCTALAFDTPFSVYLSY